MSASAPYQLKDSLYSSHGLLLASLPSDGAGLRVLDLGCAGGYLSAILAGRGYHVTGIDSPGAACAGFPESVELLEADLDRGLPTLSGRFDFVICADVLEHLRRPALLLRDLQGVLARGGKLAASLPNSGHAYFRWTVLRGRFPAEDRGLFDRTHLHFYTWRGWKDLFGAAGFRIVTVRCSGVPMGLALPRWEGSTAVRALERMSYESARWWKEMFAYQFIVTASPELEV
ncbi:MAG TPA: class I SAM-dependent methyltransferase [Bryobacteraceae bacterium]|nr:class I SAM-dependent methyltransferase [Bryobacteraceae bacterium]